MAFHLYRVKRLLIVIGVIGLPLSFAGPPDGFRGTLFIIDGPGSVAIEGPVADSDSDGLPDVWEATHGLDAGSAADAALDIDGDGWSALMEYQRHTDPWDIDTDADLLGDAAEPGNDPPPAFSGPDDAINDCELTVFRP